MIIIAKLMSSNITDAIEIQQLESFFDDASKRIFYISLHSAIEEYTKAEGYAINYFDDHELNLYD